MLRVDELDLAFLSVTERVESHGLGLHQLVSEELVVAAAARPPRSAGGARCGWPSSPTSRSSASAPGARLRELLVGAGREAGFEPRVTLESNESQRVRRLVSRGLGVAILPRSDAEGPGRRWRWPRCRARAQPRHHPGLARGAAAAAGGDRVPRAGPGDLRRSAGSRR